MVSTWRSIWGSKVPISPCYKMRKNPMKAGKAIFSEVSRVTWVLPQCARGHWSIKLASTSPSIKIIQRVFNKVIAFSFLSSFHAVLTKLLSSDVSLSGYTPARRNEAFQLSITSWFSPASSNALWSLNKFLKKKNHKIVTRNTRSHCPS